MGHLICVHLFVVDIYQDFSATGYLDCLYLSHLAEGDLECLYLSHLAEGYLDMKTAIVA